VKKRDGGDKPTVAFWPRERVNFDDVRVSLFAFPFSFPPPFAGPVPTSGSGRFVCGACRRERVARVARVAGVAGVAGVLQ